MVNPDVSLHVSPKLRAFLKNVGKGGVGSVKVGIFKDATYDDGTSVCRCCRSA